MKNQTFGIEIETTGIGRERTAKAIAAYFGTTAQYRGRHLDDWKVPMPDGRHWTVERDGSVTDPSAEVVSPVCRYEDIQMVQEVVRAIRAAGAKADGSCGIHIHIGLGEHTPQSLRRLVNIVNAKEDLLTMALGITPDRRERWCRPVEQRFLTELNRRKPATMDEFVKAVAAVSGKNSAGQTVWGLNEPALAGWNVLPYIWSNGGSITDDACTTATGYVNSPETVAAVQKLVDLYADGEFTGFNSGDIPMTDGFGTGRYMMLLEGPWKTAELAGAYPDFNYGTSEVPAGSGGSISVLGGEDIAMFNTANKDGAWKFMKFMTSEYAQEEMAKCGQIPVSTAALESQTVKDASFAPFLEAITTAKARPTVASWSEIDNALTVAMTDMIVNGADVQKTLDQLAVTIDGLLAE